MLQVETDIKYAGYVHRQQAEIEQLRRHEQMVLPEQMDYSQIKGLSAEVCQKLTASQPRTLAQAGRIPGVTPAAISLLLVHLKKRNTLRQSA
jgi:tRNA uridine 5-carboxymethylaminomethyl modification enzyme